MGLGVGLGLGLWVAVRTGVAVMATVRFDLDLDLQARENYGHDPHTWSRSKVTRLKSLRLETDGRRLHCLPCW